MTCKFIDMAVPSDKNTSINVIEKRSKYKDCRNRRNVGNDNDNDFDDDVDDINEGMRKTLFEFCRFSFMPCL